MAINTQKVIVGGVAAGFAVGVVDSLVNGFLLGSRNDAALNALSPGLADNLAGGAFIAGIVVVALLMGIVAAWTYALLRPRYGAGPKTAVFAALQLWSVITLIFAAMTLTGLFTWSYFALGSVVSAGELLLATYVAGYVYSEE